MVNIKIKESARNELVATIGDIEMTMQLILPKFLDINTKIKNQEKVIRNDMTQLVGNMMRKISNQSDAGTPTTIKASETEINDLKAQLWRAESQSSEAKNNYSQTKAQLEEARAKLAEAERKIYMQQGNVQQVLNGKDEEIKLLNGRLGEK